MEAKGEEIIKMRSICPDGKLVTCSVIFFLSAFSISSSSFLSLLLLSSSLNSFPTPYLPLLLPSTPTPYLQILPLVDLHCLLFHA